MSNNEPMRVTTLCRVLHEIMLDIGDLEIKVYDTEGSRLRQATLTFAVCSKTGKKSIVILDKESLLKVGTITDGGLST